MTRDELIKLSQHKVRSNPSLMLAYLSEYEKLFGQKPNCAGCTFKRDWRKFVTFNLETKKTTTMVKKSTSYKIKKQFLDKLFRFTSNGKPVRSYGRNMSEAFAENLLNQSPESIQYFETVKEISENVEDKEIIPTFGKIEKPKRKSKKNVEQL